MMLKLPKCQNKIKIKNQKIQGFKSIEIKQYIYIYIYNITQQRNTIERRVTLKRIIHYYSFSTIEIGQTIKCIVKNELKNSYVNQTIRRF